MVKCLDRSFAAQFWNGLSAVKPNVLKFVFRHGFGRISLIIKSKDEMLGTAWSRLKQRIGKQAEYLAEPISSNQRNLLIASIFVMGWGKEYRGLQPAVGCTS